MKIGHDDDNEWETVDDDTSHLIGGGQLRWRVEAIMAKLADVDGDGDNDIGGNSRNYRSNVDNKGHVSAGSELRRQSRVITFSQSAVPCDTLHFPLIHTHPPGKMRRWEPPFSCRLASRD